MPSVHETAYPRLKNAITTKELTDIYTPTPVEVELAERVAKGNSAKLCFLLLLKTFQRLGYFIMLRDVPPQIVTHITHSLSSIHGGGSPAMLEQYDNSGSRRRNVTLIREQTGVKPFDREAQVLLAASFRSAAQTKEELADIINVGIGELVRANFELPGFTTLHEEAQRVRSEVNRALYSRVAETLGDDGRHIVD